MMRLRFLLFPCPGTLPCILAFRYKAVIFNVSHYSYRHKPLLISSQAFWSLLSTPQTHDNQLISALQRLSSYSACTIHIRIVISYQPIHDLNTRLLAAKQISSCTTMDQWASQIRNARSTSEQISVLKALKNHLIGHPLKKELAVASGVLDPVVRLVYNRPASRNGSKSHDHSFASKPLGEEESVRLQGLYVIASISTGNEPIFYAYKTASNKLPGGPSFLPRLQSASALPAILSNICPSSNPSQIVLASVRALSNLADAAILAPHTSPLSTIVLAEALFARQHLNSICRILSQSSPSTTVQCQIAVTASLISRICREERHQQSLASSGYVALERRLLFLL